MKIFFTSILVYLFFWGIKAQNRITVINSETKQPVPYVTITSVNGTNGFYTNEMGLFTIPAGMTEIKLSSIGYFTKTVTLSKSTKRIKLKAKFYKIDEITIAPNQRSQKTLGYYKGKQRLSFAYASGTEQAVLIRNSSNKSASLESVIISVNMADYWGLYEFTSIFKINVYAVAENDMVGMLINEKPLLFSSEVLKRKTILNVSNKEIIVPPEGVFVAIEWVGVINKQTKKIVVDEYQRIEPKLWLTDRPENVFVYLRNVFSDNKWKPVKAVKSLVKRGYPEYIPRISIKISY